MSRRPRPIATFRVYPEPRRSELHYRVLVFSTLRAMRAYLRWSGRHPGRTCLAMVSSWQRVRHRRNGRRRLLPELGEMIFAKRWLTMRILTHEAGHAALGWARRVGLDIDAADDHATRAAGRRVHDHEERFCYALGEIGRGLVARLNAKRLIR